MREAMIALPVCSNSGYPLEACHRDLLGEICERWGGCSVTEGRRCWRDKGRLYDEAVRFYMVAMPDTPHNRGLLRELALTTCFDAGQEAVYVRYPSGEVELVRVSLSHLTPVAISA